MSSSLWPHGLQHPQASLSFTISQSLPKFVSFDSVMLSNHLILFCPFLLLPSVFPYIRVFSSESAFQSSGQSIGISVSISPSSEYSELIYLRMDWFDLLQPKGLSRVFSNITIQKHQFFCAQPSLWSNSHIHTLLLEKPQLLLQWCLSTKWFICFLIHCLGFS